ncbi:MAG: hypothetical protein JW951_05125 [Lentisphaerae bacterium]|nr:hypothetical protein [Lentisphaerota bacterium]
MKIPLNLQNNGSPSSREAQTKVLERDVLAAKKGDWTAKNNVIRTFTPLLRRLAEKRTSDTAQINTYMEAGKAGLLKTINKYKRSLGPEKFQMVAVEYIEDAMDRAGKRGGIFSRLFGR